MASYSAGHQTASGTDLTILALESAAAVRGRIYEFILGSDATPGDQATEFNVLRHTTAGISPTNVVEEKLDGDYVAPSCTVAGGTMTEPVYATGELMNFALNQRATFRWVAAPDRRLVTTVGTANGIGIRSIAATGAYNVNCTISWDE